MRFLTSFYRQGPDPNSALTLQQVLRDRGRMPIVLACVCGESGPGAEKGAGAAFCVKLTDWFHESALVRCGRKREPDLSALMGEVAQMAEGSFSTAGIFCVGHRFFLFYRGEQRICLLNRRFLRPNIRELSRRTDQTGEFQIEEGSLQGDVGILIGTEGFFHGISREDLAGCLTAEAIGDPGQAERRLEELGRYGERGDFSLSSGNSEKSGSSGSSRNSRNSRGSGSSTGRAAVLVVVKER